MTASFLAGFAVLFGGWLALTLGAVLFMCHPGMALILSVLAGALFGGPLGAAAGALFWFVSGMWGCYCDLVAKGDV